jgi:hypothetical protein
MADYDYILTIEEIAQGKSYLVNTGTTRVQIQTKQNPYAQCKVTYVLDVEDVHFGHDHCILMPNESVHSSDLETVDKGLSGLDVIYAALVHHREHPLRKCIVCGHTDDTGDSNYNLLLSDRRAKSVLLVLCGNTDGREGFGDESHKNDHRDDWRRILKWIHYRFDWNCDPGDLENENPALSNLALKNFQIRYNQEVDAVKDGGYTPLFSEKITDNDIYYVLAGVYKGFFDLYQKDIMERFACNTYAELAEIQASLWNNLLEKGWHGCGEHHPRNPEERVRKASTDYKDEDTPPNPEDRRVEILFFDPGEEPEFKCHPEPEHPEVCHPEQCLLYNPAFYTHRRLPPAGTEPPNTLKTLTARLLDGDKHAIAGARYRLSVGAYDVRENTADSSGRLTETDVLAPSMVTLEWGCPKEIERLGGAFPYQRVISLDLVGGDEEDARKRLHNLGYPVATELGPALRAFQEDYGLSPTGELDDATKTKLALVHDTGVAREEV